MTLDDDICYCYHVSLRKLLNFARRTQPAHPAQMSECLGAGTGCGWCVPVLCRIAAAVRAGQTFKLEQSPTEYAAAREAYRSEKRPRHQFDDSPQDAVSRKGEAPAEPPGGARREGEAPAEPPQSGRCASSD